MMLLPLADFSGEPAQNVTDDEALDWLVCDGYSPPQELATCANGASCESVKRSPCGRAGLASTDTIWRYVARWCGWLWGGLTDLVSRRGGVRRVLVQNLRAAGYTGVAIPGPVTDVRVRVPSRLLSSSLASSRTCSPNLAILNRLRRSFSGASLRILHAPFRVLRAAPGAALILPIFHRRVVRSGRPRGLGGCD